MAPWCALLPGLDVTTMEVRPRLVSGPAPQPGFDRNGNAGPTAWVDGRVVGAWRQDADGRVELVLLEDVGRRARKDLSDRADELTGWLVASASARGFRHRRAALGADLATAAGSAGFCRATPSDSARK